MGIKMVYTGRTIATINCSCIMLSQSDTVGSDANSRLQSQAEISTYACAQCRYLYIAFTADLYKVMLPTFFNDHGREAASTYTPRIQSHAVFLDVLSPLSIVSIDNCHLLLLWLVLLLVVPVLLPWCVLSGLGGEQRGQIDSPHVHHLEGVLLFEWNIRDKTGVHNRDIVQTANLPNAQDDRTGSQVC